MRTTNDGAARPSRRARLEGLRAAALALTLAFLVPPSAQAQTSTQLTDLEPITPISRPFYVTQSGSFVYFTAHEAVEGARLWKTDGTPAGTSVLFDPQPAPNNNDAGAQLLTDVGGTLFFSATDGSSPASLWKTDGTEVGTVEVADVSVGTIGNPDPSALVGWGGVLYFVHYSAPSDELWRSDGTGAGTYKVAELPFYGTSGLRVLADRLYFLHGNSFWTSDGTEAGTYALLDLAEIDSGATCPPPPGPSYPTWWCLSWPRAYSLMAEADGVAYLAQIENVGTTLRTALWSTDGTVSGTQRIREMSSGVFDMLGIGDTLYLAVEDPATGVELWTSDGTLAGTVLLEDLVPGAASSSPHHFTEVDGTLWFTTATSAPFSLWTSDGTESGTNPVGTLASDISVPTPAGGKLFFGARNPCDELELWMSEGVATGIRRTRYYFTYSGDLSMPRATSDDKVVYVAQDDEGDYELFLYDGGTPPPDTCGDGFVDAAEDCDLAGANGEYGSCCQCNCRLSPAGSECAASTGGCDVAETCDGMSDVCPAPVVSTCGDGIVDGGEECDEGAGNGEDTSCCSCDCTSLAAATVCRLATGSCDPEETCTGASGGCPADIGEPDLDYDELCDSIDACINNHGDVGRVRRATLSLNNDQSKGKLKAEVYMPTSPEIDPPANGARLVISNEDDSETIVDVTIPPGAYDDGSGTGWRSANSGGKWTYYNPDGFDGIRRFSIKTRDKGYNMIVKATMQDRSFIDSSLIVPHPLHMTIVIDSPQATTGQCVDARFNVFQCEADETEQIVQCR